MGRSTNGQLSFGIIFEEDFEFPWNEYDHDIESWWRAVKNCPCNTDSLYDAKGNWVKGVTEAYSNELYKQRAIWEKENPIPVELVNYCNGDCNTYLIATKHIENYGGDPVEIDLATLNKVGERERRTLLQFLEEYNIEFEGEPKWWLSSYWG